MRTNGYDESEVLRGNFVLLRADGLRLLLPQQDVGPAGYLDVVPESCGLIGMFEFDSRRGDRERVIAALDVHMRPMRTFPEDRFLLTSFVEREGFELCWDEVEVLIDVELKVHSLPVTMQTDDAPLRQFVEWKDGIVFRCSGRDLLHHTFASLL